MKREALGHTKIKRLCRYLNIPLWQAVGILETLWHLTAHEASRGDIGRLSNQDIALGLDYHSDPDGLIDALLNAGWLDRDEHFRLLIHDWSEHADDAIQKRVARAHQLFADSAIPNLKRLGPKERVGCEEFYASIGRTPSARRAHAERTPSAQMELSSNGINTASARRAHAERTPSALPEPEPEPEPEPVKTLVNTLRVEKGSFHLNGSSARKSEKSSSSSFSPPNDDEIERVRVLLIEYPGASRLNGRPDDEIIRRCWDAVYGHPELLIHALEIMHRQGKSASRTWAWFPKVIGQYFPNGPVRPHS